MHWHKYILDKVLYVGALENTNLSFSSLHSVTMLSISLSICLSGFKRDTSTDGAILRIQRTQERNRFMQKYFSAKSV